MEIEKQRGISVASSVLQFEYNNFCINILDTPGHQDFSEDTYRTLMAADSAVMVIDSAKGVEDQTKKLFHVCKMRGIPICTFIKKMDRQGKDPFELLEDIENVLGIRSCPVNWPIGSGKEFRGVFNRHKNQIELFDDGNHGQSIANSITGEVSDEKVNNLIVYLLILIGHLPSLIFSNTSVTCISSGVTTYSNPRLIWINVKFFSLR